MAAEIDLVISAVTRPKTAAAATKIADDELEASSPRCLSRRPCTEPSHHRRRAIYTEYVLCVLPSFAAPLRSFVCLAIYACLAAMPRPRLRRAMSSCPPRPKATSRSPRRKGAGALRKHAVRPDAQRRSDGPTSARASTSRCTDKFGDLSNRLGFTYDDLNGVIAGELALAIIERPKKEASLAILMDVTGREAGREELPGRRRQAAHGPGRRQAGSRKPAAPSSRPT